MAEKSLSQMNRSELELLKEASNNSSMANLLSDLEFIESNKKDFESYERFDTPTTDSVLNKSNTILKTVAFISILLAISIIAYFVLSTPKQDSSLHFAMLPDGTEIQLESQASFTINQSSFNTERIVHLNGNAFFDVSHNEEVPFTVLFDDTEIKVLGTSFYILEDKKEIHVRDGKVAVTHGDEMEILTQGQSISYATGKLIEINNQQPQSKLFSASYKDQPLVKVLEDLSEFLDVEIDSQGPIEGCFYNGDFDLVTAKEALDELAILFDLKITYSGDKLTIFSSSCL